jgi:hypothetical protein
MKALGLEINMSKSVVSPVFAEFAKKWVGVGIDLSPIGPGLILQSLRNSYYVGAVLLALVGANLLELYRIPGILKDKPSFIRCSYPNILWLSLFTGIVSKNLPANAKAIADIKVFFDHVPLHIAQSISNTLYQNAMKLFEARDQETTRQVKFFLLNWWKTSTCRVVSHGLPESVILFLSPGFWLYFSSYLKGYSDEYFKNYASLISWKEEMEDEIDDIGLIDSDPFYGFGDHLVKLSEVSSIRDILSIDWTDKGEMRGLGKALFSCMKEQPNRELVQSFAPYWFTKGVVHFPTALYGNPNTGQWIADAKSFWGY